MPDISLAAASRDGYVVYLDGKLQALGGTSASASAFGGLMALLQQRTASRQGNVAPTLYALAAAPGTSFHDISNGSNSVPG